MATLTVHDFSCLKNIEFHIAPVTVLIGPQGSGKSVTTKLTYFFYDQLSRQFQCAEKGVTLDEFKKEAIHQFKSWFPAVAWGGGRFNIGFSAGAFTARILRRQSRGRVTDDVSITFSDYFNSSYELLLDAYTEAQASDASTTDEIRNTFERIWSVREKFEQKWSKMLSNDYVASQTFVPAGRAFFTSIGRLVAAFDQGSSLDPVTLRFAKLFATLRDRSGGRVLYSSLREPEDKERRSQRRSVMNQLFGGEIKFERDLEFVETKDGRRVPFSILSSGQQELLPMWLLIDYLGSFPGRNRRGDIVYIEEPEAHLFPTAQSTLMDYLIGTVVSRRDNRSLLLTTHSPYILSKINNYLKAGSLGRNKKHSQDVAKIVDRQCWLTPQRVGAYAIANGTMSSLIVDGLIDGAYIDQVSEDVAEQFSALLDIEFEDAA